ncbi:MAG: hypothetical protein P8X57_11815, partial [Cyclobacteriaceae bacterium]
SSLLPGAVEIIDTDELLERLNDDLTADAVSYAYCRLFDILISDWDRHGDQWVWAVDSSNVAHPIPLDRDMTFYQFDDGLINKMALLINPKFQSFDSTLKNPDGYLVNGREIDLKILKDVTLQEWDSLADVLDKSLSEKIIEQSLQSYPENIFDVYGIHHAEIIKARKKKTDVTARFLYTSYSSLSTR